MIGRAVAVGVPFAWFTAGAACGQAKLLQARLEEHDVSYVMAIRRSGALATAGDGQRAGASSPARRRVPGSGSRPAPGPEQPSSA
jgi:SRSO17 transposase